MLLEVGVDLCELEGGPIGIVAEDVHSCLNGMDSDREVDPEKAGAIAIETGSAMMLMTKSVLTGGTTKDHSNEVIETEKLQRGGMIIRPVATARRIQLQGPPA